MKEPLIDINELSQWLGVAKGTLYNWKSRGQLPFRKVGRRLLRFAVEEIEEWLRGQGKIVLAGKR